MSKVATQRKSKRSMNVFWWIRMRMEFLFLLYRLNRFTEAEEVIKQLKPELQRFNETFY